MMMRGISVLLLALCHVVCAVPMSEPSQLQYSQVEQGQQTPLAQVLTHVVKTVGDGQLAVDGYDDVAKLGIDLGRKLATMSEADIDTAISRITHTAFSSLSQVNTSDIASIVADVAKSPAHLTGLASQLANMATDPTHEASVDHLVRELLSDGMKDGDSDAFAKAVGGVVHSLASSVLAPGDQVMLQKFAPTSQDSQPATGAPSNAHVLNQLPVKEPSEAFVDATASYKNKPECSGDFFGSACQFTIGNFCPKDTNGGCNSINEKCTVTYIVYTNSNGDFQHSTDPTVTCVKDLNNRGKVPIIVAGATWTIGPPVIMAVQKMRGEPLPRTTIIVGIILSLGGIFCLVSGCVVCSVCCSDAKDCCVDMWSCMCTTCKCDGMGCCAQQTPRVASTVLVESTSATPAASSATVSFLETHSTGLAVAGSGKAGLVTALAKGVAALSSLF